MIMVWNRVDPPKQARARVVVGAKRPDVLTVKKIFSRTRILPLEERFEEVPRSIFGLFFADVTF
jgi:hypothetical protein